MLRDPDNWACFPICPVKRSRGVSWPQLGIVVATDPHTVYLTNMYSLEPGLLKPQLDALAKVSYTSIETMLADGWEVD